jgi:hypothetical protein
MAATLPPITMGARGTVIHTFALQHFRAAMLFRRHVLEIEDAHQDQPFDPLFFEEIRSFCSACIMSSAATMEALINELFIAQGGPLRNSFCDFEASFWGKRGIERKRILEKYQEALKCLGKQKLDEKTEVYRNAWGLIELRNALIHFKPTWDPLRKRQVELRDILTGKFALSPFVGTTAGFVEMQCMSAGCATWAVDTCRNLIQEFGEKSGIDAKKISAFSG